MPRLFGVDFGVPTRVSRVAVGVLFLGNAAVVAWYFAARWRGNPMRFFFDEHGVFRPMSMRDYLEFSLRSAEERAKADPDNEELRVQLEIQRARLRVELARLEAEGVVSDQDVPLREEDLALLHAAEAAVGRVEAEVEFDPETRRAWRDALARVQRPDARA